MKSEDFRSLVHVLEAHRCEIIKANGLPEPVFDSWMESLRAATDRTHYNPDSVRNSLLTISAWLGAMPAFCESRSALRDAATAGVSWN